MWLRMCGFGVGVWRTAEEQEIQDKKATDGRKKKSSRDWGKGNWIGETDKEKSWAKYSQKVLVYFSTCSRASHAAIVDWEEKIVTTSKRLSRCGAALWKAWNKTARLGQMKCTEDKRKKSLPFGKPWNKVQVKSVCELYWCPETWIYK